MEILYKCETCGKTSSDKNEIERCEAQHIMTPDEFQSKLERCLGKDTRIVMSKFSGVETYALTIIKAGMVIKDANIPIGKMVPETIKDIVNYGRKVDKLIAVRELVQGQQCIVICEDIQPVLNNLMLLNKDKKFVVKIGIM